jgi:hypothetical protein
LRAKTWNVPWISLEPKLGNDKTSTFLVFGIDHDQKRRFVGHLTSSGELPHDGAPPKMQDLLLLGKFTSRKVVWESHMAIL